MKLPMVRKGRTLPALELPDIEIIGVIQLKLKSSELNTVENQYKGIMTG